MDLKGRYDGSTMPPTTPPKTGPPKPPEQHQGYTIERRRRYWAVIDMDGELVCLAVYRKGAQEVVSRLLSKVGNRRPHTTK